jgi:radical SAM protein with 4Fe4S-binding SPASM domain
VDLCGVCNHRCVFCFFRKGAKNVGGARSSIRDIRALDTDLLVRTLSECATLSVRAVTLVGGGEPLLHKDVDKIIAHIEGAGLAYGVITNLSVREKPKFLSSASWVRVSIDAATERTYNVLHRPPPGSFPRVLENLAFLAPQVETGVSFLIHRDNWREIVEGAKLFRGLGARYVQYKPVYDEDRGEAIRPHLDEIEALLKEAAQLESPAFSVINHLSRVRILGDGRKRYERCRIQHLATQIGADGKVYACCLMKYFPDFCLGDLRQITFADLWTSRARAEFLERHRASRCPPCWYDGTNEALEYLAQPLPLHAHFI